jgi:hypothetical protein
MSRSVRHTVVVLIGSALLVLALAGQALAHPPDPHLHCLTTASGNTHSIARGVTLNAAHDTAFHNLHGLVHQGAFAEHPLGPLGADFGPVFECP